MGLDKRIIRIVFGLIVLGISLIVVRALLYPALAAAGSKAGEVSGISGIVSIIHGGCAPNLSFEQWVHKYLSDKHIDESSPGSQIILETKYGAGLINDVFTPENGGEYVKYLDKVCENKSKCKPVSFDEFSKWKWINKAPQSFKEKWYTNYHKALCGN